MHKTECYKKHGVQCTERFYKNNVEEEIKAIGAVNCFHRPVNGSLINTFTGTNTDGEAALEPIRQQLIESQKLTIFLTRVKSFLIILCFGLELFDFGDISGTLRYAAGTSDSHGGLS